MKRNFLLLLNLILMTPCLFAQQTQNFSDFASYETLGGNVGGTEKYPYIVDSRGKKQVQGTYTFSGKNSYSDDTKKLNATYTISANMKEGLYNGNVSIKGIYKASRYVWLEGWRNSDGASSLTGVFKEGKPNGTFTISIDNEYKESSTATLKNGKYYGAYSFAGFANLNDYGRSLQWQVLKGQLNEKGELTGPWQYDAALESYNMVFMNDVLISSSDKESATPPQVQNMAKKFANNAISEEELYAQGYFVEYDSLPLNFIVMRHILNDEFNLYNIPGKYDFSEYSIKKYIKLVQLNSVTDEVFNMLMEACAKDPKRYVEGLYTCEYKPYYDEKYKMYFLSCSDEFTEKYGTVYTGDWKKDRQMYISNEQVEKLTAQREKFALNNIYNFEVFLDEVCHYDDERPLIQLYLKFKEQGEDGIKQFILEDDRYLESVLKKTKKLVPELYSDKNSRYYEDYILTQDSLYIIDNHKYPYYISFVNDFQTLRKIEDYLINYLKKLKYSESIDKLFRQYFEQYDLTRTTYDSYWQLNKQATDIDTIINQKTAYLNTFLLVDSITFENEKINSEVMRYPNIHEVYSKNIKKAKATEITSLEHAITRTQELRQILSDIESTKQYVILRDSLAKNHELVKKLLSETALKTYMGIYSEGENVQYYADMSFQTKFEDMLKAQDGYLKWSDLYTIAQAKHTEIIEKEAPYKDILKAYPVIYKTLNHAPSIANAENVKVECENIETFIAEQDKMLEYIANRKLVDELNAEITNLCTSLKNSSKAYKSLYKTLLITWLPESDNYNELKGVVKILQQIKNTLSTHANPQEFDQSMKRLKDINDIKKGFGVVE